ncbi:hypothetical protein [Amycolatopsis rubida]|uniref:Uncharacterized protein n=1 Tax=Amycolatopsis rubida TaxID=112413 RepID=A0A1I5K8Z5_9PSEU|nr:hypothetical protein [Amycolatopsis rubida]SFO81495.1 hypothetical protein SAMN05421854_10388 [Amycolatopsis rubida]
MFRSRGFKQQQASPAPPYPDTDLGVGLTQWETGSYLLMVGDVCFLNGVRLPSKDQLGTKSCDGLGLDIWLSGVNVMRESLPDGPEGARRPLNEYGPSRPEACGPALISMLLSGYYYAITHQEAGFGNFLGKIFRVSSEPIVRGALPEALGPANRGALHDRDPRHRNGQTPRDHPPPQDADQPDLETSGQGPGIRERQRHRGRTDGESLCEMGVKLNGADHVEKIRTLIPAAVDGLAKPAR